MYISLLSPLTLLSSSAPIKRDFQIHIKFSVTIKVLKDILYRDVALLEDPSYLNYVQLFASNMAEFDDAFANAWWVL